MDLFGKKVVVFILVVIDPGHGGKDPGAVGNNMQEKNITIYISKSLKRYLAGYNVKVKMTREGDTNPSLNERTAYANNLKADLFVSVHVNAGGGSGFESYVYTNASVSSEALGKTIHDEAAKYFTGFGIVDRGLKKANYAVLRETLMPAVLFEVLFIDNSKDALFLKNHSFLDGAAKAWAGGVAKALNLQVNTEWDPVKEINQLKELGIINGDHSPGELLSWGEFATVQNRIIEKFFV